MRRKEREVNALIYNTLRTLRKSFANFAVNGFRLSNSLRMIAKGKTNCLKDNYT